MIKIKALNDGSDSSDSSDSEYQVTREAEEEGLNKLYMNALKAASEGKNETAIRLLHELKDELENDIPKVKDTILLKRLKYLTYKNLGMLKDDLNLILDALEIDDSDYNLWINAGRRGKEKMEFIIARKCYESAYRFNQSNFTVITNLMDIYFILNDLYSCVNMSLRALEIDRHFSKAITLINECIRLMPPLVNDMKDYLCYVYVQYGGDYYPEDEMEDDEAAANSELISQLDDVKRKRLHVGADKGKNKRKKLSLDIDRLRVCTVGEVGQKIKAIHELIQSEFLNICTPIELNMSNRQQSAKSNGGNKKGDNSENLTQNSCSSEKGNGDSNGKAASESSQTAKSLLDFVDKRRSSRVKSIKSAKTRELDDDQSVLENLMELLPATLKTDDHSSKMEPLDKENSSNSASLPSAESSNHHNQSICKAEGKTAENQVLERCLDALEGLFRGTIRPVNIFELIECFLAELSLAKGFVIPPVFMELYQVYRDQHSLPCALLCQIGRDISLGMIWTCLTANEIKYDKNEALFLTEMLIRLSESMSHTDYRHFVIRLLVLRGTKEFNNEFLTFSLDLMCSSPSQISAIFNVNVSEKGSEAIESEESAKKVVSANGHSQKGMEHEDEEEEKSTYAVPASNNLVISAQYINTLLKMQTVPVSQLPSENYSEIIQLFFTKSEGDLTAEEKAELCKAIVSAQMWQKGIELFENWSEFNDVCLATIYECVKSGQRARLSPGIMSKMLKHASESKSAYPWSILYWALVAEGIDYRKADNPLIKLCKIGHHCLGRKGLCTANEGEFLNCALRVFIEHELEDDVLKCLSCLFNFPARKSQNSAHTSPHIELKWAHCEDIYFYFAPDCMPEFDGRQSGITKEIKDFFVKILRLIPEESQPLNQSQNITNYINQGGTLVEPTFATAPPRILTTIYYLLGDYYFKTKKFIKAKQFYIFDLTINPGRLDSWAGLALTFNYLLDQMLIEGVRPNTEKYQRTAFNVVQCFEQALRIEENNTKLWIEFGLLCYNISSNLSRMRKMAELFTWPLEPVNILFQYEEILDKAQHCFQMVQCSEEGNEELWLSYYMLGKVSEKKKENLCVTLQYYSWADLCLYLEGATYPKKISYYNPPYLAVEALEVHYRIHASALKYLLHNRKFSARMLRQIKLHLLTAERSPFVSRKTFSASAASQSQKKPSAMAKANSTESSPADEMDAQISETVDDLVSIVSERDQKFDVNKSRNELIVICVAGLRRCLARYPGHYKSYYRLSDEFFAFNDNQTSKNILLGSPANRSNPNLQLEKPDTNRPSTSSSSGNHYLPGLFSERKPTNFFNGIWRIPAQEIERAGNFNAHMFRCIWRLVTNCIAVADYNTLAQLAIQLHKTPDLDKRYIDDMERKELSQMAFTNCFKIFRDALGKPEANQEQLVQQIGAVAQTFIKSNVYSKETLEQCNAINTLLEKR